MKFKGDIIITDPWYICKDDDWGKCWYGSNMEVLGIKNYICTDTISSDCSCITYNANTCEEIGRFYTEVGAVAVFLLDEVLQYNPDFNYHIKRPWTTTLIKDFDGEVSFGVVHGEARVAGRGNIDFIGF